ncbi:MAG TPA: hypothetical protein VN229_10055 [Terriglobales bacterium]|nr:hypothetical protein [Terriglobales bacterium]
MATTIDDVLLVAKGAGPVERQSFTQLLINYATTADLSDQALVIILRCVISVQARLAGQPARLEQPMRNRFLAHLRDRAQKDSAGRALVMSLAIECAGQPLEQAIFGIAADILDPATGQAAGAPFALHLMNAAGVKFKPSVSLLQRVADVMAERMENFGGILAGLTFLGFQRSEPVERRDPIFQHLVLPLLRRMGQSGVADPALFLEQIIYNDHIKALERPEHHRDVFAAIAEPLRNLGSAQAQTLPALAAPAPVARPRIVFLLQNGYRLAHVEVLLYFLSGLARCSERPIDPVIYLLTDAGHRELAASCEKLGVQVMVSGLPANTSLTTRFERCRRQLTEISAAAVVFVSVPLYLEYLSAFKLAPVSIWWSMKFPLSSFPLLDGRVFYRLLFPGKVTIDGRIWHGGPLGLETPPAPNPDDVALIRAKYAGGPILGTVAREEKIREPAYLEAVVRIMKAHPTASYLWTGRQPLAEITGYFTAHGIADRCHFVGWVDPAVYCRVFDVFLETFPLTGLMSGWAMAAGQAVATAGPLGWLGTYFSGIDDGSVPCQPSDRARLDEVFASIVGRVPCIWARDADELVALVTTLLSDDALRRDFGACCQRFMERFLADSAGSALTQAQFFADIVKDAANQRSGSSLAL